MNKGDIRSFRFRVGKNYTQISPKIYKNGNRLSKRLKDHIARNKLFIDASGLMVDRQISWVLRS